MWIKYQDLINVRTDKNGRTVTIFKTSLTYLEYNIVRALDAEGIQYRTDTKSDVNSMFSQSR